MTDNLRVEQLLDELLESQATPEEVCRSCPELLSEVRGRWRKMCRVRAAIDTLFPAPLVLSPEDTAPYVSGAGRADVGASPPAGPGPPPRAGRGGGGRAVPRGRGAGGEGAARGAQRRGGVA